jgi:hypothetical protein
LAYNEQEDHFMDVFRARSSRRIGAALAPLLISSSTGLIGCFDRPVDDAPLTQDPVVITEFPVEVNRNLDLLFVIDQSLSMKNEQDALAANFQLLMDQITSDEYGVPNVHIGVISTNLGVGPYSSQAGLEPCGATGDGAILQNTPRPQDGEAEPSCTGPRDHYIVDVQDEDGQRVRNYDGTLAETFSCIARLGTEGCGFEQQLEAMRRALDGSVPENAGFLREDARLAIVFVSDEDDCSVKNLEMFDLTTVALGRPTDFRCLTHGLVCENGAPTDRGEYSGCVAAEDSPYMHDVGGYVSFLRELKKYPDRDILVAGIIGDVKDPLVVGDHASVAGQIGVQQSCFAGEGDADGAFPPVRLRGFFDAFPIQRTGSICSDLAGVLRDIGEFIGPPPEGGCVPSALVDADDQAAGLQADCAVSEVRDPRTAGESEQILRVCDNASDPASSSRLPCYTLNERLEACSATAPYYIDVHYASDAVVPPGTELRVHCVAE